MEAMAQLKFSLFHGILLPPGHTLVSTCPISGGHEATVMFFLGRVQEAFIGNDARVRESFTMCQ